MLRRPPTAKPANRQIWGGPGRRNAPSPPAPYSSGSSAGALLLGLSGEEQRIAFALTEFGGFVGFGLSHVPGVDGDHAGAAPVRRHHHVMRALGRKAKYSFYHLHYEFARRKIVIEQD